LKAPLVVSPSGILVPADALKLNPPQRAFQYLVRHLVCLSGRIENEPTAEKPLVVPRTFAAAGSLMSVQGMLVFVTAGHILDELSRSASSTSLNSWLSPLDFSLPRAELTEEESWR
jgi:hypothetical protein